MYLWRPEWFFHHPASLEETFNFSLFSPSILLLFLYSLVYSTVCTSAYSTAGHNLRLSKYCWWQIKVLRNVTNLQHPTFESYCAAVCINICSEQIRLLFLPHTKFHTIQTNDNTKTRCHDIISYITILFPSRTPLLKLSLAVLLWFLREQKHSHLLAHYE